MECLLCGNNTSLLIAGRLRHGESKNVYYCKVCGLGMLDNKRSCQDLRKFYQKIYRSKFKPRLNNKGSGPKELFDIYANFQGNRINLIKKFLHKKMRLLEIGCSAGMFLFHIKKYVKEAVGIDYDATSAFFAAKKCRCPVFSVDAKDTNLEKSSFDIICMLQVLEHSGNPYQFLQQYRSYLKPAGLIYVEVPNLLDALIHAYKLPNHYNFYFHTAHLWYFTANSLEKLMCRVGFKGKVFFTQDYNILNHMHWIIQDTPQADCIPGLSEPKLPLRDWLPAGQKTELNNFIRRVDLEYKDLLVKLKFTSNISFIGKKI